MRFKNIAITIIIAIACMSVAVWAKTPRVQQWEYTVHSIGSIPSEDKRAEFLNNLGNDGWELIGLDDGRAYLKRPKN
jgi:hypothetical protein